MISQRGNNVSLIFSNEDVPEYCQSGAEAQHTSVLTPFYFLMYRVDMNACYHGYQIMLHKYRCYAADTDPFLTSHDPQIR